MTEEQKLEEKPTEENTDELEKVRKERDEYLAGWQRAKADFSNYQKDEARRSEEFAKWALASLILDLLPILDSFDVALAQYSAARDYAGLAQTTNESEKMGLQLIRSQFLSSLAKYGLKSISAEKGEKFNPELHEAISREPSDLPAQENQLEDIILEEIQKGYLLHNRVLRPSKVKVSIKKPEVK
jgi:molecular chaperone GrpE